MPIILYLASVLSISNESIQIIDNFFLILFGKMLSTMLKRMF